MQQNQLAELSRVRNKLKFNYGFFYALTITNVYVRLIRTKVFIQRFEPTISEPQTYFLGGGGS